MTGDSDIRGTHGTRGGADGTGAAGGGAVSGGGGAVRAPGARKRAGAVAVGAGLLLAVAPPAAVGAGEERGRAAAEECVTSTGPYQRELEEYLKRPVDGVQSAQDCAAIRTFQTSQAITPADGYANLVTYRTMTAVAARGNPNAERMCPDRSYSVTCVDLDRQILWTQTDGEVVFDPVPIRTGRDDEETRPGWHAIYWRDIDHVSTEYNDAPMPYAQFFDGGQALHGRPDDLFDGGGSAGCVNLRLSDARDLWDLLDVDDAIFVWGTKPGTAD
ncbi:L,D-transpeptidase family protein [Streptomyces uncialis]|uniref:L,D-transpeptidase family protein n=1 Tax=Streptomyces uncialis TaxID=1048205 RepID=UPI00382636A8